MKYHDIIVGDLGRKGTLRYFKAFSEAERKYLTHELDPDSFYDEYRLIHYTIIGALPDIKHEILPDTLEEIDDSVLVGVKGGPSPLDIMPGVVRTAAPYINTAVEQGAEAVRVIIPCNTMYLVSAGIREVLSSRQQLERFTADHSLESEDIDLLADNMERVPITSPSVVEGVLAELDEARYTKVHIAASTAANTAYKNVIRKEYDHIDYAPWLPPGIVSFTELLQRAITGEAIAEDTSIDTEHEALLSACTDIPIPGTLDSTMLFARRIVRTAYERIDLT